MATRDQVRTLIRRMEKMGESSPTTSPMTAVAEHMDGVVSDNQYLSDNELLELMVAEMHAVRDASAYAAGELQRIEATSRHAGDTRRSAGRSSRGKTRRSRPLLR